MPDAESVYQSVVESERGLSQCVYGGGIVVCRSPDCLIGRPIVRRAAKATLARPVKNRMTSFLVCMLELGAWQ